MILTAILLTAAAYFALVYGLGEWGWLWESEKHWRARLTGELHGESEQ